MTSYFLDVWESHHGMHGSPDTSDVSLCIPLPSASFLLPSPYSCLLFTLLTPLYLTLIPCFQPPSPPTLSLVIFRVKPREVGAETPCQQVDLVDVAGKKWTMRHVYRGEIKAVKQWGESKEHVGGMGRGNEGVENERG